MANDYPTRNGQGSQQPGESGRLNNLQRIAQRKQQVRNFPMSKKLEKLAVYSSCKVGNSGTYILLLYVAPPMRTNDLLLGVTINTARDRRGQQETARDLENVKRDHRGSQETTGNLDEMDETIVWDSVNLRQFAFASPIYLHTYYNSSHYLYLSLPVEVSQ